MSTVTEVPEPGAASPPELSAEAARELTSQIRSAVARTIDVLSEVDVLVTRAFQGRAWRALGHESWEAYCAEEFSGVRLWESVAERQRATLRLRDAGLSERAVAAVLGVGAGTVHRDVQALSTAPDGAVDSTVGRDGRERPARRQDSEQVRRRTAAVVDLRSQGRTQVQIAQELGVAQSTVSAYLSAAAARGALDPVVMFDLPRDQEQQLSQTEDPAMARSVAGGLLTEAQIRAAALASHARTLREVVVDADAWATDPLLPADVAVAAGPSLADAAAQLQYVLAHLDLDPADVHVPASAGVHVTRSVRVREIAGLLASGAPPAKVAADLGLDVEVVTSVAREVAALPADRRPNASSPTGSG